MPLIGCPKEIAAEAYSAFRAREFARQGHLPVSGGYLDQPNAFIEAHEMIVRLEAKCEADRAKE